MKIGVDARMIGTKHRGIGRYVLELVKGLKSHPANKLTYYYYSEDQKDYFSSLATKQWPWRWYSLAEQIFLPIKIAKEGIELMIFPHFNVPLFCPVKFWMVIHDLTIWHFPASRATTLPKPIYWLKVYLSKMLLVISALRAEKIIVPTEFVREDVIKTLGLKPSKILVIYEGKELSNLAEALVELPTVVNKPFFFYVGAAYPHKNLEFLIKTWGEFNQSGEYQLVLVGRQDYFYKQLKNQTHNSSIIFFGEATDLQLMTLYKKSQALVFPSLYEGFGIPPLEAQNLNCPVISSNASCLPEILGESVIYFHPKQVESLLAALREFVSDPGCADRLRQAGFINCQRFSWEKFGQEWLKLLDQIK
jgi:glycosyltransferase involved in cell wall biosynthesis